MTRAGRRLTPSDKQTEAAMIEMRQLALIAVHGEAFGARKNGKVIGWFATEAEAHAAIAKAEGLDV